MRRFALIIYIIILSICVSSCKFDGKNQSNKDNNISEHITENFNGDTTQNPQNCVTEKNCFVEGTYSTANASLHIYDVDSKGFKFSIKLLDKKVNKSEKSNKNGTIGCEGEKTYAKLVQCDKAIMNGIDTENKDDEDYNIIFEFLSDKVINVYEERNDGSKDVYNPYSDLGKKFGGIFNKDCK